MRASLAIIAVAGIATFAMPRRSELRLPCVADANLSSYEGETRLNYGGSARIRLKGIQMLGVFRFDTGAARAMVVDSARIYLRYAGSDRRLRTLGFSTVSVPWTEGAGRGERINGAMCFAAAELGRRYWTAPDSDFTDAAFIPGSALVSYSDIRDEGDGWISAAVAPEIVQACIAGVSEGIAVTDEKGQTMANNDVYSREQSGSEPYLVTTGRAGPNAAPPQVTELRAIAAAPSEADSPAVRLSLKVPVGCVGVEAFLRSAGDAQAKPIPRHLLGASRAGRTMALVEGLPSGRPVVVTVRTIGPTGLRSAPASSPPTTPSAAPARVSPIEAPVSHTSLRPCPPRASGSALVVCHRPDVRCDPVSGAPDRVQDDTLWDGSSVSLTACRGETAAVSVTVTGRESPPKSVTIASSGIPARTFALRCVDAAGPLNDICIPVTGGSHTPESGGIEGRRSVQYLIEHDVPHDARPGLRTGELRVACDGAPPARFAVKMRIVEAAIPSRLTFDLSLNTYGSPARADGLDPASPEGIRSELGFHRLAHEHRATLTPLGYSHGGSIEPGYAPEVGGAGASRRVTSWADWDARFGPYLDGSAFADTPRARQPVTHVYLPFHEAWPEDIRRHYAYRPRTTDYPDMITEHALLAGPIEALLSREYAEGFRAVVAEFAQHIRKRGWTKTAFHFYLNNKHYYRDPKQGGRGTSWWLLDEPMNRDDWLALAWFGRTLKVAAPNGPLVFRADVSRPQWQRDYLDGLVDLMVVNDELFARPTLMRALKRRIGVGPWHYGEAPAPRRPLSEFTGWPIRAYLAGADGIVPWQTVGGEANLDRAEPTALLVPGRRLGLPGPLATMRLKALARGQQDVELMAMLARRNRWTRAQVATALCSYIASSRWADMRAAIYAELSPPTNRRTQPAQSPGQAPTAPAPRARPKP